MSLENLFSCIVCFYITLHCFEIFYSFFPVRAVWVEMGFVLFIQCLTPNLDLRLKCAFIVLTMKWVQSFFSFLSFFNLFFSYLAKSSWKLRALTWRISSELLETNRINTFYLLWKRKVSQSFFARSFHHQQN